MRLPGGTPGIGVGVGRNFTSQSMAHTPVGTPVAGSLYPKGLLFPQSSPLMYQAVVLRLESVDRGPALREAGALRLDTAAACEQAAANARSTTYRNTI